MQALCTRRSAECFRLSPATWLLLWEKLSWMRRDNELKDWWVDTSSTASGPPSPTGEGNTSSTTSEKRLITAPQVSRSFSHWRILHLIHHKWSPFSHWRRQIRELCKENARYTTAKGLPWLNWPSLWRLRLSFPWWSSVFPCLFPRKWKKTIFAPIF